MESRLPSPFTQPKGDLPKTSLESPVSLTVQSSPETTYSETCDLTLNLLPESQTKGTTLSKNSSPTWELDPSGTFVTEVCSGHDFILRKLLNPLLPPFRAQLLAFLSPTGKSLPRFLISSRISHQSPKAVPFNILSHLEKLRLLIYLPGTQVLKGIARRVRESLLLRRWY